MEDSSFDENKKTFADLIDDGPIVESDNYENVSAMRVQTELPEVGSISMNQGANSDIDSLPNDSFISKGIISDEDTKRNQNQLENTLISEGNLFFEDLISENQKYDENLSLREGDPICLTMLCKQIVNQGANSDINSFPNDSLISEGIISGENLIICNNPENMLIYGTLSFSFNESEKYEENLSLSEGDPIGFTMRCKLISIIAIELNINRYIMAPELITRPKMSNSLPLIELFIISETFELISRCKNKIMIKAKPSQIIQIGDKFQINKYMFKVCKLNLMNKTIILEVFDSSNQYKKIGEIKQRADFLGTIELGHTTFAQRILSSEIAIDQAIFVFKNNVVTLEIDPSKSLFQGSAYESSIWIFLREDSDAISIYDQMQIRVGARDLLQFNMLFE